MNKISDNKIFSPESEAVVFNNCGLAWEPFVKNGFRNVGVERVRNIFQTAWLQDDFGLIFVVKQGRYILQTADAEIEFRSGQAAVVPSGVMRQIYLLEADGEHMYMHIADVEKWSGIISGRAGIIELGCAEELFQLASLFIAETRSAGKHALMIAAKLAEAFIMCLQRESEHGMTAIEVRQSRLLEQLWGEVARRPELKWTIPDMAKRLCFSVGHFHYICRKLTGVSPLEKVISIRMEKACVLLLNTDDPLPLIAEAVGYESVYSFSRLFKKHLGVSPGRYRNG
jgi:AraC-like DNA-binding protein